MFSFWGRRFSFVFSFWMKKLYLEVRVIRFCMGTLLCDGRGRMVVLVFRCVVLLGSRRLGRGFIIFLFVRFSVLVLWVG